MRTTSNLHLNLASSKQREAQSKAGSQQSTTRNIPKGSITFHNKQHESLSKELYDSSKTKRSKKEHPSFFEVRPSQINLDKSCPKQQPTQHHAQSGKEPKQSFVNFLNKAPLPKPSPCLIQKQDSRSAQSEAASAAVSSLLQQNKTISHTLNSLLSELKSLFFYEDQSTKMKDRLRSIVTKYENLAKEEFVALKIQSQSEERSRSTSVDTKERLKAFINRQDYLNQRSGGTQTQTGSVTLKSSSIHENLSKEEFDELDLRNSIQSIDQRLSLLIGQTHQMFAAQQLPATAHSTRSMSKDMLKINQRATNSQSGTNTTSLGINDPCVVNLQNNTDLFQTKQQLDDLTLLRSSQESIKNMQSSATSSSRRAPSPSPYSLPAKYPLTKKTAKDHQSQPKAKNIAGTESSTYLLSAVQDPHKRSQSVTSRSNTKRIQSGSSPIGNLHKVLLQIGQQTQSYEVKHTFVKHFSARLQLLEQLAWKYQSEVPHLYDQKQRSRQPITVENSSGSTNTIVLRPQQTLNSTESPKKSVKQIQHPMMMFETSDKTYNRPNMTTSAATKGGNQNQNNIATLVSIELQLKQLEEKETDLKRQEAELLASKEKVFTKWQEYIEKSEQVDTKENQVKKLMESALAKELELETRARQLDEKEANLANMKTQLADNSSGDSLHSVFFISEKEAQLKQKEQMLEQRQQELESRADEINFILKSFGNSQRGSQDMPLQQQKQHQMTEQLHDNLQLDSVCDLPMQMHQGSTNSKMHLDLFKQNCDSASRDTQINKDDAESPRLNHDERDGPSAKYESPKFFVGSGSPVSKRKLSSNDETTKTETTQQKEVLSKAEMEQHFSFQRAQLHTDQSQEDEEELSDQDYGESFAEEFRLKQAKMLGELQSIYDVKTGLSEKLNQMITQDLTVEDPDEVGPANSLLILDNEQMMPEAVQNIVETPSSLANDSQLHQLLSNMHNQIKDIEDNNNSDHPNNLGDENDDFQNPDQKDNTIDDELILAKEIAERNEQILLNNQQQFDDEESQDSPLHNNRSNKQLNNSL